MSTPENAYAAEPKQVLHVNLQALDRQAHRQMRLSRSIHEDHSPTRGMNALYLNAVEFFDACREYPIVFVRAGESQNNEPPKEVVPMVVLGLKRGENLYLESDGSWNASYAPAFLRAYPFALVRTDENNYIVAFDANWSGFSETEGQRLFDDAGEPTEFTRAVQTYLETLDSEMQRTRGFGERLIELGLLQDMRFDATLQGGESLVVDGFMGIDEKKFSELSDETIVELHRNGMLALIHAMLISMGNMRRLVERRVKLQLPA